MDAAAAREERVSAKPGIVLTHVNDLDHHHHHHDDHEDDHGEEEGDDKDDGHGHGGDDDDGDMLVARMRLSPWVSTCLVYVEPSYPPARSGR